jgi:hypothetical protein
MFIRYAWPTAPPFFQPMCDRLSLRASSLSNSTHHPSSPGRLLTRSLLGGVAGFAIGATLGALLDAALTGSTYAGLRIGGFLGALIGGQLAAGTGLFGFVLMIAIVLCSAVGVGLAATIVPPAPDELMSPLPLSVGGVAGAFVGLGLAVWLARTSKHRSATVFEPTGNRDAEQ